MVDVLAAFGVKRKEPPAKTLTEPPKKKYLTRRDKEELARKEKEAQKSAREQDPSETASKDEKAEVKDAKSQEDDEELLLSPKQAMIRLRTLGQPITLFGETHSMRVARLREFELHQHERNTGSSEGARNVFYDMSQEVELELLAANAEALTPKEQEDKKKEEERAKRRASKYDKPRDKTTFKHVEDYVLFWIKRMLHEWEVELDEREQLMKDTYKGKLALASHKQTRKYIKPLCTMLKKKTTSPDILKCLDRIVDNCLIREYRKANEVYMEMAIGNAPWPMGVTMVGIHERAGRAKIFTSQVAHVLNDDTHRKFIQAVKRLMTFSQFKYPNVPSKNVL